MANNTRSNQIRLVLLNFVFIISYRSLSTKIRSVFHLIKEPKIITRISHKTVAKIVAKPQIRRKRESGSPVDQNNFIKPFNPFNCKTKIFPLHFGCSLLVIFRTKPNQELLVFFLNVTCNVRIYLCRIQQCFWLLSMLAAFGVR